MADVKSANAVQLSFRMISGHRRQIGVVIRVDDAGGLREAPGEERVPLDLAAVIAGHQPVGDLLGHVPFLRGSVPLARFAVHGKSNCGQDTDDPYVMYLAKPCTISHIIVDMSPTAL